MEYKFSGQINFNEYHQYIKLHSSKFFSKENIIKILILILLLVFCFFMFIKDISRHNIKPITIELAIGLIVVIPYFLWFLWTLPTMYRSKKSIEKYAKKLFELDKKIKEKYDYIINENKIIINSKKENITLNKYNINKITFDIDSIYIFHGKKRLYIIKKRFFDNEGEFDEIILFLKGKYNGNKKNSNGS